MNIHKNIPIVYNPVVLDNIKEMIKEGFDKLNCFVKTKINEKTLHKQALVFPDLRK